MPDIALFIAASALLAIAPGPDVVYVLTRGISQGPKAGIAAALGFASGCIFHTLLAALGIAALIRSSDWAFDLVRYAGAAYLAWIGIQALRHRAAFSIEGASDAKALAVIYKQSVIGNMLNPKVTLFFLAFLPQFVDPSMAVAPQALVLGAEFIAIAVVSDGAYALIAGTLGERVRRSAVANRWVDRAAGGTLVGLGGLAALSGGADDHH